MRRGGSEVDGPNEVGGKKVEKVEESERGWFMAERSFNAAFYVSGAL